MLDEIILNHDTAMMYCADDEDIYREVLESYIEQSEEYFTKISLAVQNQDWDNCRIIAHGIKSTSFNIGAEELSAEAKEQELMARDGKYDEIMATWQGFQDDYSKAVETTREYLDR
jgi:HPt (histidine-containing phosphotransfer) domain-containing protein